MLNCWRFKMEVLLKFKLISWSMRWSTLGLIAAVAFASVDARAAGASVSDATDAQKDAAKDKYQAGMQAFDKQKYDEALGLFRESYGIVASPNSHLMIARVLARLDRLPEAYNEYQQTVAEAEREPEHAKYRPTAKTARTEREELETHLAFITPRMDATVSIGGVEVPASDFGKPLPVKPGAVDVVLRTASGETHQQINAEAGKKAEISLQPAASAGANVAATAPTPCPEKAPSAANEPAGINQTTLALVIGGIGVAGAATFAVFGILNNSKYEDLQKKCANNICSSDLADEGETGRKYQTIANIGLGVGAVGIATSVILLITAPSSTHGQELSRPSGFPDVAVSPRSVSVRGRF